MLRRYSGDATLSFELGAPILTRRRGGVRFKVGPCGVAVEHIIGREVNQKNSKRFARLREVMRAVGVDRVRQLGLRFRAIHSGVCGAIEQHIGLFATQHIQAHVRIGKVECVPRHRHDFMRPSQPTRQRQAKLTVCARNQQLHA